MKILMIMNGKGIGGAELQFLELVQYLSSHHQVRLLFLGGDGALKAKQLPKNIEVRCYYYKNRLSALLELSRAWLTHICFRKDATISTSVFGNFLALALSVSDRKRLVSLQTVSKALRHSTLDRFTLNHFDVLVAGSKDVHNYLIRHGQNETHIKVVNNWVDFSSRTVTVEPELIRKQYGIADQEIVIGCIGRMHPQKGQEYLIRAFRNLLKNHANLKLMLVGDGPTMESMRAEAHDLCDSVIFTGSIVGEQYNNLLKMFDIYVQPSRFEGLPRTLLDAMFMGKPVIATAVNGNLDAIQHEKNGLLVPSEQSAPIEHAIEQLLRDATLTKSLGAQARKDVENDFEMIKQLKKIEVCLSSVD